MRFLCVYKSSKPEGTPPTQQEMERMGKLIEESMKSSVLLSTEGCLSSAKTERSCKNFELCWPNRPRH